MENNPYASPQSELAEDPSKEYNFYVVSIRKFSILFLATLGLYSIYWFYANWKSYKDTKDDKIWPIARAIFNIFFAHALFAMVDEKLEKEEKEFNWSPNVLATFYVILSIASNILDRMALNDVWSPSSDFLSLAIVPPLFYIMLVAQKAVNLAEGDIKGAVNAKLTWANYLWIVFGAVIWLFSLVGVFVLLGVIPAE